MAKTMTKQVVTVIKTLVTVEYPTIGKKVSIDYEDLNDDMKLAAGLHGLKQKLGDAKSGGSASEKFEMAERIVEALQKGEWELSGGGGVAGAFIEALMEFTGKDEKTIRDAVANADDEKLKQWRNNAKVKAITTRILAERAAAAAEDADDDEIEI